MHSATVEPSVDRRYIVLELLGRGGMGAVYRVRDERSGRELALKRLLARPEGGELALRMFEREFRTLSQLAHPRIIEVYDYGVDDEGAYYTMELLGGQDLRALGKVDWATACALLHDVASSLAILHSRRLLHGDLSPRNVRCTRDGRAKLLDFGAMTPMGVRTRVVGTPPFVAPETMHMQPLDGRADLFALGALAYFLLTGMHAYPARTLEDLRDVWRTSPRPPIELAPQTPPALSQLVLELLQRGSMARPRTAGVVMQRLCAIASLPVDEHPAVAEAYLTTPTLVGRDEPLAAVRARLLELGSGRGSVVVVQGAAGSGRSRLLDACVLEAKLLGMHVLRSDAGDAAHDPYGLARLLVRQMHAIAPAAVREAAGPRADALAQLVDAEPAADARATPADRRKALALLRDVVLNASRSLHVLLALDDVDHIDDASRGQVVELAVKAARRPICVLATIGADGVNGVALDLLRSTGAVIDLPALGQAETERLLRSVFGDVNHVVTVARRIHAIARGNPRATMQLAGHLVAHRLARYEAGGFVLPAQLSERELPPSVSAVLERRVAELDPDALELARVLALTEPRELPAAAYPRLTGHGGLSRTYGAIDRLLRAEVLDVERDRYRFSQGALRSVLCAGLGQAEREAMHARLASVFEDGGTLSRRAYHLMESAQPEAAIRALLGHYFKDPTQPRDPFEDNVPGMLDLFERAAQAAERLNLPAPLQLELRMKAAAACHALGEVERFLRLASPMLPRLHRDSGLRDYELLDPALEPHARLAQALTGAQQRHDRTPEAERGLGPADAIRELARCCALYSGVAISAGDPDLLYGLPSLVPLTELSPAIAIIQRFLDATRAQIEGRAEDAHALFLSVLERLSQPDGAGLSELYQASMRNGALYIVGMLEAGLGLPGAADRTRGLESVHWHRVNAQRVYLAHHLMQSDAHEAAATQNRAELLMLQDGELHFYPTAPRVELFAYVMAEDLNGLKQVNEQLARAIQRFPTWMPLAAVGRSQYRRLQGDFAGALRALEPALGTAPLRSRDWSWMAATHAAVLTGLGRGAEAVELGRAQLAACERAGLGRNHRPITHALAETLIAVGEAGEAADLAQRLIADALEQGVRGLLLGWFYELAARAAIALLDEPAFDACAELCAAEYRIEHNAALAAKYERLMLAAGQQGFRRPLRRAPAARARPDSASEAAVRARLLGCADRHERMRAALAMLMEQARADRAFLYGLSGGGVALLCAADGAGEPPGLGACVERFLHRELAHDQETALVRTREACDASAPAAGARGDLRDGDEPTLAGLAPPDLQPLLIATRREGRLAIAGIAVLGASREPGCPPLSALIESVAAALIDHDDLDVLTCVG